MEGSFMHLSRPFSLLAGALVLVIVSLACSLPTSQPQTPPGLAETSIALGVQQTSIASDKATLAARNAATATDEPSKTPVPPTDEPPSPSDTPQPPTATAKPTQAQATNTATVAPSATAVDIEAKIRSANILVYEDMMGSTVRKPLVHEAISEMNFSGGRVIEVGDALGNFKGQLINTTSWDLIIVAAEWRTAVQGEFWKYVYDQVNRNVAVVIEAWYLDKHYSDIEPLLNKCGLEYQKNWGRGAKYKVEDYVVYWLQPDHPFFGPPQQPVSLANPNYLYWVPPLTEDAGDLLSLASSGDAVLLGGTQPGSKSQYGVLGTCLNGTMIIQTFSSHDYKSSEVVKLWKNYMHYTLTNHFLQKK
jgi:hypothetical protein